MLRGLLEEGVPIRDLVRILEALTEQARTQQKDTDSLLEAARIALQSTIGSMNVVDDVLAVITLAPSLEQNLLASLRLGERGRTVVIDAALAESIVRQAGQIVIESEAQGRAPVLLCANRLRPALRRLLRPSLPRLTVLGAGEVVASTRLETIGSVSDGTVVAA